MATRTEKRTKLIPPDGGWGWLVLIGTGVSNIFNQSMLSLFSLLYGDALEAMGHDTSGAAIVLSSMLFVTNFGGPIAGALTKLTSPRFVAVFGACCCTIGIFFSGFATNIWHLMLTYGLLLGTGLGFIQNSSFVAINSYFKVKKSLAVGLAMTGTGIGQTLMPHVVRYLLENYGYRGACLLLASLSLHGIGGTMLIQPVEWHMKKVEEEVVIEEKVQLLPNTQIMYEKANGKASLKNNDESRSEPSLTNKDIMDSSTNKRISQSYKHLPIPDSLLQKEIFNGHLTEQEKPKKSFLKKCYDLFDISLLSSARFLNIIIGTSLTVVSVQNFSLIFPLFLQKAASMNKQQTAYCMSAVASVDIVGRIVLPMIQDRYKISARMMLVLTSTWIIIVRQFMANQTDLFVLLVLSGTYGFGRSMIIVARNIAISEHCRMDQVPSAVGLGMLSMGLIVPPAGYFLGWIRDYTGSYLICITAQNALLVIFLIMWIPDLIYLHFKAKNEKANELVRSLS